MADLLSTGISGVRTYQRALATVGNNIANVDTDGYSRQRLEIVENSSSGSGVLNIGSGARAVQVKRIYDNFLTSSLRINSSQLAQHEAIHKYVQQLENTLADKKMSLSSVIDGFYASVHEVTISPASASARQSMLNTAESVASQFQSIGSQITRIDEDSFSEAQAKIEELNLLAKQVATVNGSLNGTMDINKQPNGLMDMRDKLLQDMSQLIRIFVEEEANGQVNIHIGDADAGEYLVNGKKSNVLGLQANPNNPEDAMLVMNPNTRPSQVKNVSGGSIGGILSFRQEALQDLRIDLDHIARVFVNENNAVHELGIDAHGRFGGELFSLANVFSVEAGLNQGNASVQISTLSDVAVDQIPMELRYDGSANHWVLTNTVSKASVSGNGELVLGGVKVKLTGQPETGDIFSLVPSKRAIDAIAVAISDQSAIAAGGAVSVARNATNSNETRIILNEYSKPLAVTADTSMDDALRNNIAEVAGTSITAANSPAFIIPANTQNPRFYLDNQGVGADVQLQVFTRAGRQIYGEALTVGEQGQLVNANNGFLAGASYNNDYLNKTGANGYMDGDFVVINPDANDSRQHFALQGHLGEDLIVFVTGTGTGHMSAQWDDLAQFEPRDVLRQDIDIQFSSATSYQLIDSKTETSIASGTLLNNSISHNGWQVSFEGPVVAASKFSVKGNTYMAGDNRNMLAMANLQSSKSVFAGQGDFTEVYTDVIGVLGNRVVQTAISADAQRIMVEQAEEQRNQTSAVSLDEEAADLLRFQQAYQASAQIINTANKLFDTILNVS
ncbi:MAG: flagellar hook-associated protein FlgK [Gammaproteobacteria bacterium]|nr:flagellar hook-associated protein FlgK [Gammaproteobacteria bacterium]